MRLRRRDERYVESEKETLLRVSPVGVLFFLAQSGTADPWLKYMALEWNCPCSARVANHCPHGTRSKEFARAPVVDPGRFERDAACCRTFAALPLPPLLLLLFFVLGALQTWASRSLHALLSSSASHLTCTLSGPRIDTNPRQQQPNT